MCWYHFFICCPCALAVDTTSEVKWSRSTVLLTCYWQRVLGLDPLIVGTPTVYYYFVYTICYGIFSCQNFIFMNINFINCLLTNKTTLNILNTVYLHCQILAFLSCFEKGEGGVILIWRKHHQIPKIKLQYNKWLGHELAVMLSDH